ncbi:hypothetical protein [Kineosporia mesophila]|uniref:hypothetical protein n=1 Tax=Kineosporia mesophila TaxID=566012 RepID=UPI0038B3D85F
MVKRSAPEDTDAGDIIDTEVACLALARDLGLTTVEAEVICFGEGDLRAIAVSRYDRMPGLTAGSRRPVPPIRVCTRKTWLRPSA